MDLAVNQRGTRHRWSLTTELAGWGLQPITNIACKRPLVTRRKVGRIVVEDGRLQAVYGRWWPYYADAVQAHLDAAFRMVRRDRCELFYHSAKSSNGFLTLDYLRAGPHTTLSTLYGATLVLDEIARLKQSVAIVAHVTNERISNRLLERLGWQAHCLTWKGRHFIKRFYGDFPCISARWRKRLSLD